MLFANSSTSLRPTRSFQPRPAPRPRAERSKSLQRRRIHRSLEACGACIMIAAFLAMALFV